MSKAALPHDHGQDIEHSLEKMPGLEDFQIAADIFKQLGDGSRLRIFWLLCHCEECVINISSLVDMRPRRIPPFTAAEGSRADRQPAKRKRSLLQSGGHGSRSASSSCY